MFSGIIETIGRVKQINFIEGCKYLTIIPEIIFDDLTIGDSISVNGVCLTVTSFTADDFNVTIVPETLRCTNLNTLIVNSIVNLERSLKIGARLGGHFVQGHVEGIGKIIEIHNDNSEALLVKICMPSALIKYIIKKGFIALDGMSITIIDTAPDWFTVTFIPHTQAVTIVKDYTINSLINIEVDILGKYIENILGASTHAIT